MFCTTLFAVHDFLRKNVEGGLCLFMHRLRLRTSALIVSTHGTRFRLMIESDYLRNISKCPRTFKARSTLAASTDFVPRTSPSTAI